MDAKQDIQTLTIDGLAWSPPRENEKCPKGHDLGAPWSYRRSKRALPCRQCTESKAMKRTAIAELSIAHGPGRPKKGEVRSTVAENEPRARKIPAKEFDSKNWHRARRLKSYGLTEESYQAMLVAQNHKCPLCSVDISEARQLAPAKSGRSGYILVATSTTIAIDHCHATGRVRGLLCLLCNRGLGDFKDDVDRLRRAADYLEARR